ncbi:MAG: hypothetical protein SFU98_11770 [Leptospiraceae bacterium]|nr:hypothetical protein [Leptospiraceae bacterium]
MKLKELFFYFFLLVLIHNYKTARERCKENVQNGDDTGVCEFDLPLFLLLQSSSKDLKSKEALQPYVDGQLLRCLRYTQGLRACKDTSNVLPSF